MPLQSSPDDELHLNKELLIGKGNAQMDLMEISLMCSQKSGVNHEVESEQKDYYAMKKQKLLKVNLSLKGKNITSFADKSLSKTPYDSK